MGGGTLGGSAGFNPVEAPTLPTIGSETVERRPGMYWVLAALQVLDVVTTYVILRWFFGSEANPIVDSVFETTGLFAGCALLLWLKLAVVRILYEKGTGVKIMSAIYSMVIFNNLLFLGMAAYRVWL